MGISHCILTGTDTIFNFSPLKAKLPVWFGRYLWEFILITLIQSHPLKVFFVICLLVSVSGIEWSLSADFVIKWFLKHLDIAIVKYKRNKSLPEV